MNEGGGPSSIAERTYFALRAMLVRWEGLALTLADGLLGREARGAAEDEGVEALAKERWEEARVCFLAGGVEDGSGGGEERASSSERKEGGLGGGEGEGRARFLPLRSVEAAWVEMVEVVAGDAMGRDRRGLEDYHHHHQYQHHREWDNTHTHTAPPTHSQQGSQSSRATHFPSQSTKRNDEQQPIPHFYTTLFYHDASCLSSRKPDHRTATRQRLQWASTAQRQRRRGAGRDRDAPFGSGRSGRSNRRVLAFGFG